MSFLAVVFVVLMILALVGGGYVYSRPSPSYGYLGGSYFLIWLCLAILGYVVLGGGHTVVIH